MILDFFAGPGGWSEGLRRLGLHDVGVEWDTSACRTRVAAGFPTIQADAEHFPVGHLKGKVTGLIASPPCQDFSVAGKGAGLQGEKGRLIDLVPGWVDELRPEWVACEQVPPCLLIWRAHAIQYRAMGYSVWTGILNAADFGVPQTRKRAFLIASRIGKAVPPTPTHDKAPEDLLWGDALEPWVSMQAALGWGTPDRPFWTVAGSGTVGGAGAYASLVEHSERDSWVVQTQLATGAPDEDGKYRRYQRPVSGPAPTVTSGFGGWQVKPEADDSRDPRPDDVSSDPSEVGLQGAGYTYNNPDPDIKPSDQPAPTLAFGGRPDRWKWVRVTSRGGWTHSPTSSPSPTLTSSTSGWEFREENDGISQLRDIPADQPVEPASEDEVVDPSLEPFRYYDRGQAWPDEQGNRVPVRMVPQTEPAPTITGAALSGVARWRTSDGEAPTASSEGLPDESCPVVPDPDAERLRAARDGVRITLSEALVLQSFPPDYPVQGTKAKQYEQVGNVVPPEMARAVVAAIFKAAGREL